MISAEEVLRIAALAKLDLAPDELERMQRDLGRILELVDQIEAAPAAANDATDSTPLRADEPRPSLDHDEVAANAPQFLRGHFVVPRILGGDS